MKISQKSVTRAVSGADRLIDGIPYRTRESIKSLFYFLIFALMVAGSIFGVIRGRESATIKSAPIIDTTNEAFEVRIKREQEGGDFSTMLDTELINEMKRVDMEKIQFPTRVNLEPEIDRGIIEPEKSRAVVPAPEPGTREPLFEGEYRTSPGIESDVKPIEKRTAPVPGGADPVMESEKRSVGPVESGGRTEGMKGAPEVKRVERNRNLREGDIRSPGPLLRDEGIIGN